MAVKSVRTQTIVFSGDVVGTEISTAATNTNAGGVVELKTITGAAFQAFTVPTFGAVPPSCTIIPPAGNTASLTLKGVTGDTGFALHLTDPSVVSLASTTTTFGITTGATVTGLRLIWS